MALASVKSWLGGDTDAWVRRVFPFVDRLELHPDTLTLAGTLLCGVAAWAFASGRPVVAGLVLLVAGWCDLADGVVARRRGQASAAGAFLDSTLDRVGDLLIFGGIAVGAAARGQPSGVALAFWAAGASFLVSYARARAEAELRRPGALAGAGRTAPAHPDADGPAGPAGQEGPLGRFERFVLLIAGGLTTWMTPALLVIAAGSTWTAIERVRAARARLAQLRSEPGEPRREDAT